MPATWKKGDLVTVNFFDSFKMGNRTEDGVITWVRKDGLIEVQVEKPIRKRVTVPENEVSARGGKSMNKQSSTPSPWQGKHNPGPLKEEHAFAESAFPPNSIPFLNRMKEVLDEARTNSLQTISEHRAVKMTGSEESYWKARALLWVINAQFFGQVASIDMDQEWGELNQALKAGKF